MELRSTSVPRIVVVRALKLGDMLCAIPALRALRAAFPSARVTLVALPWTRAIEDRIAAYVDEIAEFPGYPGIPERDFDPARTSAFVEEMRRRQFDLAIQLHGDGRVMNEFVEQLGARRVLAFRPRGHTAPTDSAGQYLEYPEGTEVRRLLSLVAALGVPASDDRLEFPLKPSDAASARRLLNTNGVSGRYACVHPGSAAEDRRWPASAFAEVGDGLAKMGFAIVLTGTEAERELTTSVARAMSHKSINLAGYSDLGTLAGLLAGSRVLVSNDTGVAHLAVALQVPSVVVFSGSDRARWTPSDHELHRVLGEGRPDEQPSDWRPSALVSAAEVLEAARDLVGVPA